MTQLLPKPERQGHPFLTYDMIWQIPAAMQATLTRSAEIIDDLAVRLNTSEEVYLTGCGSALYAAMLGENLFRLGPNPIRTRVTPAFELHSYPFPANENTSLIAVSHSGITKATLDAIKAARGRGSYTVGISHFKDRPMTELVDELVLAGNGPDRSRCHTKCYVAGAAAIARLGLEVVRLRQGGAGEEVSEVEDGMKSLPLITSKVLRSCESLCRDLAERYLSKARHYIVGGGPNVPTALESALKLKETCFVSAEGLEMEEMHHGPWVSLDDECLLTVVAPRGPSHNRAQDLVRVARIVGTPVIAMVEEGEDSIAEKADHVVELPPVPEVLSPFIHIIPIYLFAYYSSVGRGANPDELRYLTPKYWEARQVVFPPGSH